MRMRVIRGLAMTVACSLALLLASCFDVPLGDPSTSKVDERLIGYWHQQEGEGSGTVVAVAALDAHVYAVAFHSYERADAALKHGAASFHKAWLTSINDTPFLTIQPLNEMPGLDTDGKPAYIVAKLAIEPTQIVVNGLRPEAPALANLADSAAFAAALAAHLNDPAIYTDNPITYRKLALDNADDRKLIDFARGE